MKKILVSLGGLVAMATAAEAHVGVGHADGLLHGFMHPVGGMDHVLAMVAVGLFAAILGGRSRSAVPLSFMGMMVVGGALGMAGIEVPFVEMGIALSVVVLGAVVALQWKAPIALAMSLVGVFAIFHGVAHGVEMPSNASGLGYAAGFVAATGILHGLGLAVGLMLSRVAQPSLSSIAKLGGGAIAATGVALLGGAI